MPDHAETVRLGPDSAKLARGRECARWNAWFVDHFSNGNFPAQWPPVATIPEGCPYPLFEQGVDGAPW